MNLNRNTDLDLLIISLNSRLKPIIRKFKSQILSKYQNNVFVSKLFKLYDSVDEITKEDYEIFLDDVNASGDYRKKLIDTFDSGKKLTDVGVNLVKDQILTFVSQILLDSGTICKTPLEAVRLIQSIDLNVQAGIEQKHIKRYKLSTVDISKVDEEFKNPIPSFLEPINKCFVTGGYLLHQLINVVAPPACGKSLYLMNEAVNFINQGLKVLYVALGDLTESDFISRMTAIYFNETIDNTVSNLQSYWIKFKNKLGDRLDNLELQYIEPDTVSIDQLYDFLVTSGLRDKMDVIILDYDSNFKSDNEMYAKGNEIYSVASKLSREVKLVFLASQPKISYYEQEVIPQEGAAESARKSQIVDVMITIGRHPTAINPVGYINLAKVRRGGKRYRFPYILNPTGRFEKIPLSVYNVLANVKELKKVEFTDSGSESQNMLNSELETLLKDENNKQ